MTNMSDTGSEELAVQTPPNRWSRIGYAARKKGIVFNNALCHINVETLREAYKALDASKAVGIDGANKKVYGRRLEANLKDP
jgi:hypothetical protein